MMRQKKRNKKRFLILLLLLISLAVLGIVFVLRNKKSARETSTEVPEKTETVEETTSENNHKEKPVILDFVDVFGVHYQTEINENVPKIPFDLGKMSKEGQKILYEDKKYKCRYGVDVSYHQGAIDWNKVKMGGYEFAIIRIGYRGYSEEGTLNIDPNFYEYVEGAQAAGLDVGVYFFAQAVNEGEAQEEAEFVLSALSNISLQLPVVYDPESILDDEARTDHVTGEQFTKNTLLFCETVKEAGYQPMVYSNMLWEAYNFDMEEISVYPIWYADYEDLPQTPYAFEIWQYDNEGTVDGIQGATDLNIQFIKEND